MTWFKWKIIKRIAWMALCLVGWWVTGPYHQMGPSLGQILLAAQNEWAEFQDELWSGREGTEERFRIVLCWLEDDWEGVDTRNVEDAFSGVKGIALARSARIVAAPGAADEWRAAVRQRARQVLEDWNAEVVIVGRVKKASETLSLWFVPLTGDGTLERGDQPYRLENVTLGGDFHNDLSAQPDRLGAGSGGPLRRQRNSGSRAGERTPNREGKALQPAGRQYRPES